MLYLNLDDMVIKRARNQQIARNSREITNAVLWCGLGTLISTGVIGMTIAKQCAILIGVNKITKWSTNKVLDKNKDKVDKIRSNIKQWLTKDRG